ncbi:hypothetical protein P0240_21780 [Enterobacter cloacae]|uniref:hypothetical protein n=1 Tax=Enterobacter cloacae TaxID=550 RepID=UPI0034D4DEC5
MTKANERRQFRFALVKDILRCESVRKLPHDHKKLLFRWLANGWSITDTPPDTSRIRALEKVASDAHRLWSAINNLDDKDEKSLNFNYGQTAQLSLQQGALQRLEQDAAALASIIKGEQADIVRLRKRRTAKNIVNTLCMFGVPCNTRNDRDISERNVTTAMRCVMFAMLEGGVKKPSWGTTTSIIKLGVQMLTDPNEEKVVFSDGKIPVTAGDAENFRLFLREMPEFNGIKLVE